MEDIVTRPRYPRRTVPAKRRKRSARENSPFIENFMRQVVFALIILVLIGIVKSVNTPVTNFLSEKAKYLLSQDVQIKEVYTKVNGFLDNLLKDDKQKTKDKVSADSITTGDNTANLDADLSEGKLEDAQGKESADIGNKDIDQLQDEDILKIVNSMKEKYSFLTPVEGSVTSAYGERIHPVWKTEIFHSGVDIEAEKGVPIKAALEGIVLEASNSATYGKYIKMEHEDGIITLYGHCSQLLVKKGQKLDKGETIAKVGNTGVSVGTHLHFEIWKDGKPLDPLNFIKVLD